MIEREEDRAWQSVLAKPAFTVFLPFPDSALSGHNKGHWRTVNPVKNKHKEWARVATQEVLKPVREEGDIRVHVRFIPPDRRGDRFNFPNRIKPYIDGVADAMGVNDKRFLPSFEYLSPSKPGCVEIEVFA